MSTIDEMSTQLRSYRQSITRQIQCLNEIMEKSNNVLLQMEAERSKEQPTTQLPNKEVYSYSKDTEHMFSKTLEIFLQIQHLPQDASDNGSADLGFADYLLQNCKNLQFLSSNARKLLAVGEIMNKVTKNIIMDQNESSTCEIVEE